MAYPPELLTAALAAAVSYQPNGRKPAPHPQLTTGPSSVSLDRGVPVGDFDNAPDSLALDAFAAPDTLTLRSGRMNFFHKDTGRYCHGIAQAQSSRRGAGIL